MKVINTTSVMAGFLALSSTVLSMPSPLQARQADNTTDLQDFPYSTGFIEISGPAFPGGPNITSTGSAEDFYNKVVALNPNYDSDFATDIAAEDAANDDDLVETARNHKAFCFHDNYASTSAIRTGIHYLNRLHAQCSSIKNFCERVSCSENSGIYLCNGLQHKLSVPCHRVAKFTSHGLDVCATGDNVQVHIRSGHGWRVDIAGTDC